MMRWCHGLIFVCFCRLVDISRRGPRYPWQNYFFNVFAGPVKIFYLVFKTYFIVEIACAIAVVFMVFCFFLDWYHGGRRRLFFFIAHIFFFVLVRCVSFFSSVLCDCRTPFVMPVLSPWWSRRSRRIKATQVWQRRPASPCTIWPPSTPPIR